MKVLLVDDHPLFLAGLGNLLTAHGVDVLGTARDGMEALEKARALQPEIILLDIQMPQLDGLAALRLIKAELPEIKIVMLTMSAEDEDLFEAIKYKLIEIEPCFDGLLNPTCVWYKFCPEACSP